MANRGGNNTLRFLDFPFRVGGEGGVARTEPNDHLRDLIEQVLFTNAGERVNLPEFGCGMRNLIFAGNNEVLRATVQFVISQNLNRWLGNVIRLEQVKVNNQEETLVIEIIYSLRQTLERQRLTLNVPR
jgi:Bacteriophage baseplate protein W